MGLILGAVHSRKETERRTYVKARKSRFEGDGSANEAKAENMARKRRNDALLKIFRVDGDFIIVKRFMQKPLA